MQVTKSQHEAMRAALANGGKFSRKPTALVKKGLACEALRGGWVLTVKGRKLAEKAASFAVGRDSDWYGLHMPRA